MSEQPRLFIGLGMCTKTTGSTVTTQAVTAGIFATADSSVKDRMLAEVVRRFPASEGYSNHASYASPIDAATIRAAFAALPPEPSKP